jgi:hypothetical protein
MNTTVSSIARVGLFLLAWAPIGQAATISEIFFNPPSTDAPNEYIELFGAPNATISVGTYLLFLEGDNGGSTTAGARPGDVQGLFDLGGRTFGSNGYLVLRQFTSPYTVNASANTLTAASTGWGGLGFNTSATAAGDIENISFTAMTVSIGSGSAPVWGNQLDSNNDGTLELPAGWSILDSIGVGDGGQTDRLYGAVNFSGAASGTVTSNGGLLQYLSFNEIEYLARVGNSTGNTLADWAVADVGFTSPATVVDSIVNGPDAISGVQESWNLAAGTRITDTLGSINPVPEPSTIGLVAAGLAAAGLFARRRR